MSAFETALYYTVHAIHWMAYHPLETFGLVGLGVVGYLLARIFDLA